MVGYTDPTGLLILELCYEREDNEFYDNHCDDIVNKL